MSLTLREQLLAAGLGTKKQARQAEHQQRQQEKNKAAREEQERRAAQAKAEKAARDAELNRKRQENAERKERWAQIKQLIEQHRLPKVEGDDYFNFIDRQKVRRVCVDASLRERIMSGTVRIVRCEGRYDFVTAEIAERIRERDERAVVNLNAKEEAKADENDPYKDYVVPDDLTW
jgi:uncharacterized protein YaiL (DUF2058 family)